MEILVLVDQDLLVDQVPQEVDLQAEALQEADHLVVELQEAEIQDLQMVQEPQEVDHLIHLLYHCMKIIQASQVDHLLTLLQEEGIQHPHLQQVILLHQILFHKLLALLKPLTIQPVMLKHQQLMISKEMLPLIDN